MARFKIVLKGDRSAEGHEEIDVRFDNTVLTVGDNDIDLVIANDDTASDTKRPLLLLPNQTMPEPDSGCFAYQVSTLLDRPATQASTVNAVDFTSVPLPAPLVGTYGTATPGSDYTAFGTRTLAFAKGARASPRSRSPSAATRCTRAARRSTSGSTTPRHSPSRTTTSTWSCRTTTEPGPMEASGRAGGSMPT